MRLSSIVCQVGLIIVTSFVSIVLPLYHGGKGNTSLLGFVNSAQAAEEAWEQDFNDICSRTTDSMSLSREELQLLIARCEKLEPIVEGLDETRRKVYRKRLEMCKNLLVFVLESKQKPGKE